MKAMIESNLKPCPFCGSTEIVLSNWGLFRCWCTKCLAKTADEIRAKDAVKAWNRRATERSRTTLWYYPNCPTCGEIAYDLDKCCFCGQVFEQDDDRIREFDRQVQIERDGYTIIQASNHHVHIYDADGRFVSHASCAKKMTEDELLQFLAFIKSLRKEE